MGREVLTHADTKKEVARNLSYRQVPIVDVIYGWSP